MRPASQPSTIGRVLPPAAVPESRSCASAPPKSARSTSRPPPRPFPGRCGAPAASLGFELTAGQWLGRLDQRPEPLRWVRAARERLFAFELGNVRSAGLRQRELRSPFPPASGPQGEDASVIQPGAEPAANAAPPQGPVRRIEVDVAVEPLLQAAGADAKREGVRQPALEQLQRWC